MYDVSLLARSENARQASAIILDDSSHASWSSLVGIVTAIIGNVLISFALNTQRYAHIRIDREYNQEKETAKSQKKLPKSIRGYGSTRQQEEIAEERARANADAPGLGNEDDGTNAYGEPDGRTSIDSDATAKPHEKDGQGQKSRKSYLRSPYWWVGIILMTIGEAGNFLAYGFAPASIVSPLGVVALISNCLIAPLMLKERFRQRDFWGVIIAIGGAVTVVLSAKTSETRMGPDDLWHAISRWEFLTYIGITCVFIICLMVASPRYGKKTILIDLGLVGLFGGYTALSTKGVASMLSGSLWLALTFPITYALIAVLITSAIMQIRYINRALSNFNSTQVIPTQFVLFTLSVIIGSAILYRDFEKTNADHAVKFVIGCALTFSGVWLITSGRKNEDEQDEDGDHDERIQLIDEEARAEQETTPVKQESLSEPDIDFDATPKVSQRRSIDDLGKYKPSKSPSIPSFAVTPYDENLNQNPWVSSTEHLDSMLPPKTPPNPRQLLDRDETPFFTPTSVPGTTALRRPGLLGRTDSSPANPQTPSRPQRAPGPPDPDSAAMTPSDSHQARPGMLRSARGSISRLIPGPFLGSLSSSSLNTFVAESLLKGEGSPQGPIRSRSYSKRPRAPQSVRAERNRRLSANAAEEVDLESGTVTPSISRWQTRDSLLHDPDQTRPLLSETDETSSSSQATSSNRPALLPSFNPSIKQAVQEIRDKPGKDPDRNRDESDDETGPQTPAPGKASTNGTS